jgi:hypothetical protein
MTMMKMTIQLDHLLNKKKQQQRQLTMLSRIVAILQCLVCLFAAGATAARPLHRARPIATLQKGNGAAIAIAREEWSTTRRRVLAENVNKTKVVNNKQNNTATNKTNDESSSQNKKSSCEIILDNYFGTQGLDRQACSSCEKHASLDQVYVLTCAFVDVCEGPFCATEDLGPYTCYERVDTYYVQTKDFKFFQDLGFAGEFLRSTTYLSFFIYQYTLESH